MFEDSSGEESVEPTCGLKDNGIPSVSASTSYNTVIVEQDAGNSKSLVSINQNSIIHDEETLIRMTDEEQNFFENYKKGKLI